MQLARIKLRWLNALPLDQQLLLGKVLPHNPPDLLKWYLQQIGDDSHRDDGLCILGRFLSAIAEEKYLPEREAPLLLADDGLHL